MKKVLILYKFLPQYRVEFFDKLRDELYKYDIELTLIYGKLKNENAKKGDERSLEWATYRENKIIKIGSIELLWQPCLDKVSEMDLVIVEQANSLLVNYLLILLSKTTKLKFAFWGHGANLQDNPNSIKNKFKYLFLNQSDYWFAYTKGVKQFLVSKKISENKVTVVNNAIDTQSLKDQYNNISTADVDEIKIQMNIKGDNIAIYCGGMYKEKRLNFLLEVAQLIRNEIKDFELILVGDGPERYLVEAASVKYTWIHYVGAKFGEERIPYFKMAELFLMPGLVGLAVLDTFATQTPMVTTDFNYHSPEIEYLENNENGIMTENTIEGYSQNVIELFQNKKKLENLKRGCQLASKLYNTEDMVNNFKDGVLKCLDS